MLRKNGKIKKNKFIFFIVICTIIALSAILIYISNTISNRQTSFQSRSHASEFFENPDQSNCKQEKQREEIKICPEGSKKGEIRYRYCNIDGWKWFCDYRCSGYDEWMGVYQGDPDINKLKFICDGALDGKCPCANKPTSSQLKFSQQECYANGVYNCLAYTFINWSAIDNAGCSNEYPNTKCVIWIKAKPNFGPICDHKYPFSFAAEYYEKIFIDKYVPRIEAILQSKYGQNIRCLRSRGINADYWYSTLCIGNNVCPDWIEHIKSTFDQYCQEARDGICYVPTPIP